MRSPWLLLWTSCTSICNTGERLWSSARELRVATESGRGGLVLRKEEDWIDGCCVIIVKLPLQQSVKITLLRAFANTHSQRCDSYRHTDTLKRTTSPSHAKPKRVGRMKNAVLFWTVASWKKALFLSSAITAVTF